MKKIAAGLMTILLLVLCASAALAAPEPTKLVEVFRKPGVNYGGFKSIGNEVSVSIRPACFGCCGGATKQDFPPQQSNNK